MAHLYPSLLPRLCTRCHFPGKWCVLPCEPSSSSRCIRQHMGEQSAGKERGGGVGAKGLASRASVGSQGNSSPPLAIQAADMAEQRRTAAGTGTQPMTAVLWGFIWADICPNRSGSVKTGGREIKFPLKLQVIIEEIDQSTIVETNC